MNNKQIAVAWAKQAVSTGQRFIMSDEYFKPFNGGVRRAIIRELAADGIVAWDFNNDGAFLFNKGDSRVRIAHNNSVKVGLIILDENTPNSQIILFPEVKV